MDNLGLVETVDGLGQPLSVLDGHVSAASIAVMDHTAAMQWPPIMHSRLPAFQNETGMRSVRHQRTWHRIWFELSGEFWFRLNDERPRMTTKPTKTKKPAEPVVKVSAERPGGTFPTKTRSGPFLMGCAVRTVLPSCAAARVLRRAFITPGPRSSW
jgi:hypothetical protein